MYRSHGKRLFDVAAAIMALLFLSLLLLLTAVLIRLGSKGSPFFLHLRVGRGMRPFRLIKFRTMTHRKGAWNGRYEPGNSERVTRMGRVLRKTKLDEILELINVLKGDMSLVGPRPEVAAFVKAYPDDFRNILKIRPGLTDYASIKYRDEEKILANRADPERYYLNVILPDKLGLARRYLNDMSLKTDIRILRDTVKSVFRAG